MASAVVSAKLGPIQPKPGDWCIHCQWLRHGAIMLAGPQGVMESKIHVMQPMYVEGIGIAGGWHWGGYREWWGDREMGG